MWCFGPSSALTKCVLYWVWHTIHTHTPSTFHTHTYTTLSLVPKAPPNFPPLAAWNGRRGPGIFFSCEWHHDKKEGLIVCGCSRAQNSKSSKDTARQEIFVLENIGRCTTTATFWWNNLWIKFSQMLVPSWHTCAHMQCNYGHFMNNQRTTSPL